MISGSAVLAMGAEIETARAAHGAKQRVYAETIDPDSMKQGVDRQVAQIREGRGA